MRVLNNVRRENFPKDFRVYMPQEGNGFLGAYCDSFDGDIILKYANNEAWMVVYS